MITKLLQELQKSKIVKVTGSYADGTQHNNSDIDFAVKENHPDLEYISSNKNIQKIINILDHFGIKWQSNAPSTVSTIGCHNPTLKIELEFSALFHKRANKLKKVIINKVEFNTY